MPAIPALVLVAFLVAAVACSLAGRGLMAKAAFGVSPVWGLTVLLVPFGPYLFQMKHGDLAHPTRHWRNGSLLLGILFFANGGIAALESLDPRNKAPAGVIMAGDTNFKLPAPATVALAAATPGQPTPAPAAAPASAPAPGKAPAPGATPSKAVAAASAAMPPAPTILSPAERLEANRKEFQRLAEWYDTLKHERGYLRKGDMEAMAAYNAEAAKYQTALQLAKTEQADLTKVTAKK